MRNLRWLVPLVVGAFFLAACGTLQATVPELSESIRPAEVIGCPGCEPEMVVDLLAGQDTKVGTVTVTNDSEFVCVTYALNQEALAAGWLLYETHLYVGATADFPLTRTNTRLGAPYNANPIPGLYPYGDSELEGVEEWKFCISLEDLGVEPCDEVFVAAHAVIKRTEVLMEAPYGGASVVDTLQAWRIDHTPEALRPVREQRSNPDNVLEVGTPGQETFYSLGYGGVLNAERNAVETFFGTYFDDLRDPVAIRAMESRVDEDLATKLSDTASNAGWIIIEFDPPALNVDGVVDLQVVEDTWGLPYPLELAAVFGRADAADDWTFLFLAHNQEPVDNPLYYHTYTNGSLGELDQVVQVLVQDVSDPQWFIPYPHSVATLDGFDLNAVLALSDHVVVYDETAWGDGDRFNQTGNWGLWFKYTVCPVCVEAQLLLNPGAENGMLYWDFTSSVVRSIEERDQSTGMVYPRSGDFFFDFTGANVAAQGIGYMASMSQEVDVVGSEGCPFSAGGWIQTELWPDSSKTGIEDNDYGRFVVTFYDDDDFELSSSDTGIIGHPVEGWPTTDGKQYAKFELTGTVPADAAYAIYELKGYLIQGSFINVFYDDLYFWVGR